jgi:hypothetical protein
MRKLQHTCLVALSKVIDCADSGKLCLVIDYCSKGELMDFNEETR